MKTKLIFILLSLLLMLTVLPLSSCTYIPSVSQTTVTRVTVEAGAAAEFMVNYENNVVSAAPLNDEATVIMAGEELTGMTPDKSAEKFTELAASTGFISATGENTVKISVSGNSDYAEVITGVIKEKIEKKLKKLQLTGSVEVVEPALNKELRELIDDMYYMSDETLENYMDAEMYFLLPLCRQESAPMHSDEIRIAYFRIKQIELSIANMDETASIIEAMGDSKSDTLSAYKAAVDEYREACADVTEAIANAYVKKDSACQKALADKRGAMVTLIATGSGQDAYDAAKEALKNTEKLAEAEIAPLRTAMYEKEDAVLALEEDFDDDIRVELRQKALEKQDKINTADKAFRQTFIDTYKSELDAALEALKAVKAQMTENNK